MPWSTAYQSKAEFWDERPTWVTARWFQFFIRPQQTQAVQGTCKKKEGWGGKKQNKREWQWSTEEYVNSHCKQKHGALNQEWKSRAWAVCEITVIADINNQASTAKAMRNDDRCLREIRTRVMQHKIIMSTKVLKWNTWGGFWLLKPHSSPCRPEQYAPVPDDATDMSVCVCLDLVFVLCEKEILVAFQLAFSYSLKICPVRHLLMGMCTLMSM